MKTRAVAILVTLLCLPVWAASQEPLSELEIREQQAPEPAAGSAAVWADESPVPGEVTKFRIRGECLRAILADPRRYELTAGGESAPARLILPEPRPEPDRIQIDVLSESGPEEQDLVLELDRGETPAPINRLELFLAGQHILAKVYVAAHGEEDSYEPAAEAQLIYQELSDGSVRRLTTIAVSPGTKRFMRVRVIGQGGAKVQQVTAWLEPESQPASYAVAAALGPMRDGILAGEHIWPVILQDSRLPLIKLKVLADAPGEARQMSVVRDHTGAEEDSSTAHVFTWADSLPLGSMALSNKWINLPGNSTDANLMISVNDGSDNPLQLKGVQVYAGDVWLVTVRPQSDDLVLWTDNDSEVAGSFADFRLEGAVYGGEFSDLSLDRPAVEHSQVSRSPGLGFLLESDSWKRVLIYGAAALVLLVAGLLLIRKPRHA